MLVSPFSLLCGMGFFAIYSSTMAKSPVLPLFATHLGATASGVGLVAAVSPLAGIAFSIPAGLLSDRFGRRAMLLAAGVIFASAPALYLFTGSLWQLGAIRLYHGIATAIFMPVAMAFVADLHESSKGEKLGWFSSATLCGRFLAPLTGGWILGVLGAGGDEGFFWVYLSCMAAGVLAFGSSFRVRSEKEYDGCSHITWKEAAASLKKVASNRHILMIGAVEAAVLFMYGTIEVFLPLFALNRGLSTFEIGLCLSAQITTLALTKPALGRFSDHHGRSPQIIWGAAIGAASVGGLIFCENFVSLFILSILTGLS
ncbi:MAG: MFS transporter, partial [Desulfobacterales bacterium]|nr:MFS transporter [Desulfobacterales bacterium]